MTRQARIETLFLSRRACCARGAWTWHLRENRQLDFKMSHFSGALSLPW